MSKKVKCKTCINMMLWNLPDEVTADNISYVKQCVAYAKKTFICGNTMKSSIENMSNTARIMSRLISMN